LTDFEGYTASLSPKEEKWWIPILTKIESVDILLHITCQLVGELFVVTTVGHVLKNKVTAWCIAQKRRCLASIIYLLNTQLVQDIIKNMYTHRN